MAGLWQSCGGIAGLAAGLARASRLRRAARPRRGNGMLYFLPHGALRRGGDRAGPG
ncbi:protein of unknown function [Candidatus Bipolaricaulis anaerobius]|uniref:Uncharacterized protein n=1 Tax=Candidatus Bipolaricaulis anaerobius TaxID=2026885 RepID=A0A2X3KV07_9BACT|nr:protein of unknown function [Candidatus Bipolaricaulis anaerobius]